jgi:hypothetical protein
MGTPDSFELDIQKQDDLRHRWTLSRADGRVLDQGADVFIADCLATATARMDPERQITIIVDGVPAGDFVVARTQLEPSIVALEIGQAVLTRRR